MGFSRLDLGNAMRITAASVALLANWRLSKINILKEKYAAVHVMGFSSAIYFGSKCNPIFPLGSGIFISFLRVLPQLLLFWITLNVFIINRD